MDNDHTILFVTIPLICKIRKNWFDQVLLLFAAERKLYDKIFQGIGKLNEEIFAEVTSASLRMIVNFVEVIVKCPHGPENLFIIFEMFDVIHELQSDVSNNYLFFSKINLLCDLTQSFYLPPD